MNVDNFKNTDPFAEEQELDDGGQDVGSQADYIHIRIQQRNGRKMLTTLQGMPKETDYKKLLKAFKKEFACNGHIVEDEDVGNVFQLQGDQRVKIQNYLVQKCKIPKTKMKVHGF